jgi:hypothetical protein
MTQQERIDLIMETWREVREVALAAFAKDKAVRPRPFAAVSRQPVTAYVDLTMPASVDMFYYLPSVRNGVRIIECDGIMVEAWS